MKTILIFLTLIAGQKTEYRVELCETCTFHYSVTKNGEPIVSAKTETSACWFIETDCGCKIVGGGK